MPFFSLFMPKQAVGANLVYFDLFNASGSAQNIRLHSVVPVVSGAVAVTGVVGIDLFLTRTTAVGTGGTGATVEGTDPTAATLAALDSLEILNTKISARLTPSGGATAGAVIEWASAFGEETTSAPYQVQPNLARLSGLPDTPPMLIPEGTGFRIVQGSVASVGNVGFNVVFETVKK